MKLPPAIIIGMEKNGLGVTRALAACDIPCVAVSGPPTSAPFYTNTCRTIVLAEWSREALLECLIRLGKGLHGRSPLLITKDEAVLWISELREQLSAYFHINLPSRNDVDTLMNKQAFTARARKMAWPIPKTWVVNDPQDFEAQLDAVAFPCILKPQVKNSVFRSHTLRKAFKAANKEELVTAYRLISEWEPEVVIQQWIEGNEDRIAFCLTYWTREGRPAVMFCGRKLRQYPAECGNTALSAPAPKPWRDLIIPLTREIGSVCGLRGLASLEFKIGISDDIPYIMEPTVGRTNYQNELAVINQCNIPAVAYLDMIGRRWSPSPCADRQVKLVDGVAELKSSMHYYRKGELSFGQWIEGRSGEKRYMLLRTKDLRPFLMSVILWAKVVFCRFMVKFRKCLQNSLSRNPSA